jgi:hypothetical protein
MLRKQSTNIVVDITGSRASMPVSISLAFKYLIEAIVRPGTVFDVFRARSDRLQISLWLLFFFSLLYSFTALLLYLTGILPVIEPWIPVSIDKYYLYQTFWTIPWGLATAMMLAGSTHVLAVIGRRNRSDFNFEDALIVTCIAWVVPSFVLMWLPETLIVPLFGTVPWPAWVDLLRLSILAPIWYIILVIIGVRKLYGTGWLRSIITGLIFVAISFGMFIPVMR